MNKSDHFAVFNTLSLPDQALLLRNSKDKYSAAVIANWAIHNSSDTIANTSENLTRDVLQKLIEKLSKNSRRHNVAALESTNERVRQ